MEDIGAMGFGRDATTGLGKFAIESEEPHQWKVAPVRHFMTLAPCAPRTEELDAPNCFYQPTTRFGRHGGRAALTGAPFKRPILLLRTGALLSMRQPGTYPYHGCGIGGTKQPISSAIPQTVHQGYAPLAPLNLELRT
jgi:CRISPR-associated protein Csm4